MKTHRLTIRQCVVISATALATSNGGCSCFGPDPDSFLGPQCFMIGDYLTPTQVEDCTYPQLIGKNDTAAIIAVPIAKPVSDENPYYHSVTTRIISVATNGSSELIRELDFLPGTIVSNGDYIAWVTRDAISVMAINRTSPDPWTAVDLPYSGGAYLELAGTKLGIGFYSTSTIVVVDVSERRKILQVDTNFGSENTPGNASWAISKDWLVAFILNDSTIDTPLLKRYSLADSSVTIVTRIGPSDRGSNLVIDSIDNSAYWPESDPPSDAFSLGATRLRRWSFTTNQKDVRDPQFIEEYHAPLFPTGPSNYRILLESANGTLVGEQYDNGSRYFFIRQSDDSEQRVLIESQSVGYPTLVNNHMIWLDNARRKIVIFEPESQNTSEFDIPQ